MKSFNWTAILLALVTVPLQAQQNAPEVRIEREVVVNSEAEIAPERQDRLREAQRALEAAAREVARLSAGSAQFAASELAQQFEQTGRRAMLGITIDDHKGRGAEVTGVSPGGPADEAGIEAGALIVGINGEDISGESAPVKSLIQAMSGVEPGDSVRLRVVHNGNDEIVEVTTKAFEPQAFAFSFDTPGDRNYSFTFDGDAMPGFAPFARRHMQPWADMELVELTPQLGDYFGTDEGILVVRAPEEGGLDLVDGDVILEIGGRKPRNTAHALRILRSFEPGEEMALSIMRKKRQRGITFKIPEDKKVSQR